MSAFKNMFGGTSFNATNVQPAKEIGAVPTDWYEVSIVDSAIEPTQKQDGNFLKIVYQILSGEYANRKIFDRLNLDNPNQTAVRLAQEALSAMCHATNVMNLSDPEQLYDIPFGIKVVYEPPKGEYGEGNRVKGWCKLGEIEEKRAKGRKGAAPAPAPAKAPASPAAPIRAPAAAAAKPTAPTAPTAPKPAADNRPVSSPAYQPWRRNGAEETKQEAQQDDVRN
jgi:hypothetical protein